MGHIEFFKFMKRHGFVYREDVLIAGVKVFTHSEDIVTDKGLPEYRVSNAVLYDRGSWEMIVKHLQSARAERAKNSEG